MATMPPPVSPLAQAQARAGVAAKRAAAAPPVLRITWDGTEHLIDLATFTIRQRYSMRAALKAKDLPGDDEDLAMAAAIWVHLNRLDASVTLDDVLDTITAGDVGTVEAGDSPEA